MLQHDYCDQLETAVQARVTFLNTLTDSLNKFKIIESEKSSASVFFKVTASNKNGCKFNLTIKNTSDKPIQAWTLVLSVDGDISTASLSGNGLDASGKKSTAGSYICTPSSGSFTLSPENELQGGYLIPAGGSVSFKGSGSSINSITGATLNGVPCSVSFSK